MNNQEAMAAGSAVTRRATYEAVLARTLRHGTRAMYEDAALYDALYRRSARDGDFYVELARRHSGPVLELGAGTGRVAARLAQAGVDVVGVEVAPAMLLRARERIAGLPRTEQERVTLVRADARRLALGRRFPLVIAPFNFLLHFCDTRELLAVLAGCRRHLAPRGRLAFDVLVPDLPRLAQDPERLYAAGQVFVPEHGTRYRLREASHYDVERQIRSTTFVLDPIGRSGQRRIVPLVQRQIFPAELSQLLAAAGFTIERRSGDFAGGALTADSESQVVIARSTRRRRRR